MFVDVIKYTTITWYGLLVTRSNKTLLCAFNSLSKTKLFGNYLGNSESFASLSHIFCLTTQKHKGNRKNRNLYTDFCGTKYLGIFLLGKSYKYTDWPTTTSSATLLCKWCVCHALYPTPPSKTNSVFGFAAHFGVFDKNCVYGCLCWIIQQLFPSDGKTGWIWCCSKIIPCFRIWEEEGIFFHSSLTLYLFHYLWFLILFAFSYWGEAKHPGYMTKKEGGCHIVVNQDIHSANATYMQC